jgi:hypothetical protein
MRREPEVIIGAKVQNGLSIHYDLGALRTRNDPFGLVKPGGPDILDFLPYSADKIFVHIMKLKRKYSWLVEGPGLEVALYYKFVRQLM